MAKLMKEDIGWTGSWCLLRWGDEGKARTTFEIEICDQVDGEVKKPDTPRRRGD
jgi:hypothetical protein